jgi:hypothetical protein
MDFLKIAARVSARPEPELDLEADQDLPEFRWRTKPAGPGDWIPDMYVKTNEGTKEILKDGDIVGWTGGKKISKEKIKNEDGSRSYIDLEHREVVTDTGFVGWVSFWLYGAENGRGFEPVSKGTKVVTAGSLSGDKENIRKLISEHGYKKLYDIVDELEDHGSSLRELVNNINSIITYVYDLNKTDGGQADSEFSDLSSTLLSYVDSSKTIRMYLDNFKINYDELPEDEDEDEYLTKKVLDQMSVQDVMDS